MFVGTLTTLIAIGSKPPPPPLQVLNEGGSAIVQQLLTYVFGTKKLTPKEINHTKLAH